MNLGVVGSRSFADYKLLEAMLDKHINALEGKLIDTIISGGAVGADTLAVRYAKSNGIDWQEFKPEWSKYRGKSAAVVRNKKIVDHSDILVAFWDGKSKGTAHTVRFAKEKGIPVHIYWKGS